MASRGNLTSHLAAETALETAGTRAAKRRARPAAGLRRKRPEIYGTGKPAAQAPPRAFHVLLPSQKGAKKGPGLSRAYLERLELLEHVADDSGGRRLVGVGHGPPARLGPESLAQAADAAAGAQVHLAGDRSCNDKTGRDKKKKNQEGGMRKGKSSTHERNGKTRG